MEKLENKKIEPKDVRLKIEYLEKDSKKGFTMLAGINRPVTPQHVTKIAHSIERKGVKRPVIIAIISFITGVPIQYIIDGQHLYFACLRLNIEIPYTYIEIKDDLDMIETLALLNTSSKSWSMQDYMKVWSYKKTDYISLNKYFNIYDIELSQLADILMNNNCLSSHNAGGNSNITSIIKTGQFKIQDEKRAIQLLNYVTDALKIVPRMDRFSNKLFISSFINFVNNMPQYNHKKILINLQKNKEKFRLATQDPEEFKKLLKTLL
jgi:hypothetical protein